MLKTGDFFFFPFLVFAGYDIHSVICQGLVRLKHGQPSYFATRSAPRLTAYKRHHTTYKSAGSRAEARFLPACVNSMNKSTFSSFLFFSFILFSFLFFFCPPWHDCTNFSMESVSEHSIACSLKEAVQQEVKLTTGPHTLTLELELELELT